MIIVVKKNILYHVLHETIYFFIYLTKIVGISYLTLYKGKTMKLTTKGRYAVMAMADLASNQDIKPVSLNEIATRQNISLSYLEQLFLKLRNNHLVKSIRGSHGGYMLEKKAKDIKLSSIIFAVDEEVKTLNCKKDSKKGCDGRSVKCITHYLWDDLEKHINNFFESKNLNDLISKQESTF